MSQKKIQMTISFLDPRHQSPQGLINESISILSHLKKNRGCHERNECKLSWESKKGFGKVVSRKHKRNFEKRNITIR
jgi:hypothetical protein